MTLNPSTEEPNPDEPTPGEEPASHGNAYRFGDGQYVELDSDVLQDKAAGVRVENFTLEIKFATTSQVKAPTTVPTGVKSEYLMALAPMLIGTRAWINNDNSLSMFTVAIDDGQLKISRTSLGSFVPEMNWVPDTARNLNDGRVHTLSIVVNDATEKIFFVLDGVKSYSYDTHGSFMKGGRFMLCWSGYTYANTTLPCDIYEVRCWRTVRTGDWAEIDGSEEGLDCWLKASEEVVVDAYGHRLFVDYSGHERHATIYGAAELLINE